MEITMNDVMYKVVFEGDLLPGYEQAPVQKELAKLFHIEIAMAGRLFIGKQREIKKNISFDQAKEYVRVMSKMGALAFMLPQEEDDTVIPESGGSNIFESTAERKANAFESYFESKAVQEEATFEVPQLIDPSALEQSEWDEVSGERKVRDIETIARQILQQRNQA